MNSLEKETIIEKLNYVINSRSSTLSNNDVELLVTVREQIRHAKTKAGINKILIGIFRTLILSP